MVCCFSLALHAQEAAPVAKAAAPAPKDTLWRKKFEVGLTASQTTISNNWTAGGANAYAFSGFFNGSANYKSERITWDNRLELLYSTVWASPNLPRKANDRIWLDSKVGYNFSEDWSFFASGNFQSQFYRGETYTQVTLPNGDQPVVPTTISSFMAPGFLTQSIGLEYKPVKYFYIRFGLISARQTFQLSQEVANTLPDNYGLPFGRTGVRNEGASQIQAEFNKEIMKNITVLLRAFAFKAWQTKWNSEEINSRFDLNITAKVNKYISANFQAIALYQKEQHPFWQFSTALSAGFLYTF